MYFRVKGPLRSTIVSSNIYIIQSRLYCKARRKTCQARLSTEISAKTILTECFCGFDETVQITNQGSVVQSIVSLAKSLGKGSLKVGSWSFEFFIILPIYFLNCRNAFFTRKKSKF